MNKPFVIITGMHRSGTSFLSRCLNLSGLFLGTPENIFSMGLDQSSDNPKGHWEHKILKDLADMSLSYNGASWDDVPLTIQINNDLSEQIIKQISELLSFPSLASGFKDPRMCVLFDSWKDLLPTNTTIIGIFRHPLIVAESLKIRNNMTYDKSINLWMIYNQKLLETLKNNGGFLINFDWPKEKLFSEIKLIMKKIGLLDDIDLSDWFSESLLRSNKTTKLTTALPLGVQDLYDKLITISENNDFTDIDKNAITGNMSLVIKGLLIQLKLQNDYFIKTYHQTAQDKDQFLEKVIAEKDQLLENTITSYTKQINEIKNSKIWKIARLIDKFRK